MDEYRRRTVVRRMLAVTGAGMLGTTWVATHPEETARHWDHFVDGESYDEIDHEQQLEDRYDAFFQFEDTGSMSDGYEEPFPELFDTVEDDTGFYVALEIEDMGLSGTQVDIHVPDEERVYGQHTDKVTQNTLNQLEADSIEHQYSRWIDQLMDDAYGDG